MATNTTAAKKTTRKKKTAAELKEELEKAKKKVEQLEARAYEGELSEAISTSNIVSEFQSIKAKYKDIPAIAILQAIGRAAKIPRVVVTQSEPQKRASKKAK